MTPTQEQIVRAARKMCALSAEACGVDEGDNWKVYGDAYLEEARVVLTEALAETQPAVVSIPVIKEGTRLDEASLKARAVLDRVADAAAPAAPACELTDDQLMDLAAPFHDVGGVLFDEVAYARAVLRATAPVVDGCPAGWKLVPEVPTAAMAKAGAEHTAKDSADEDEPSSMHEALGRAVLAYASMIEAAPAPGTGS